MSKFQPSIANGNFDQEQYLEGIKTDLVAIAAAMAVLTAQLDADGGVTDTDYAANVDVTLVTS